VFLQESGQPLIDVINVGVGASHLDPEFDPFNIGNTEVNDFRYCGKQFSRSGDGDIYVDTVHNTRKIKPFPIEASGSINDKISGDDITRLRSVTVTGSLAWVASKQDQIWHTELAANNLRSRTPQSALYVTQMQLCNLLTRVIK